MDLKLGAIVRNPDGSLFYAQAHEFPHLEADEIERFKGWMEHLVAHGRQAVGKDEDNANLTATLSHSIDSVAQPDIIITSVTRAALNSFQTEAHKIEGELLQWGKDKAAKHAKKK